MSIKFFLEYNNQVVTLPVNPQSLKVISAGSNKTEEIVKLGEINLLKDMKLKTITIESFFPRSFNSSFLINALLSLEPLYYINFINDIRNKKKPVRLVISDTNINMLVSIDDFEYGLVAGDIDINYKLTLKEYKVYGARQATIKIENEEPVIEGVIENIRQKTDFSIGDSINLTGKIWSDKSGKKEKGNYKNILGKINYIAVDKTTDYKYQVADAQGKILGWISKNQMMHR